MRKSFSPSLPPSLPPSASVYSLNVYREKINIAKAISSDQGMVKVKRKRDDVDQF